MLKTPDWSETDLRKVLIKGKFYLKFRQIIDQPLDALKLLKRLVLQPVKNFSYIQRITKSGSVWRNPAHSPEGSLNK